MVAADQKPHYKLFWILAISGAILDLGSKFWAFSRIGEPPESRWTIVPEVFSLTTSYNRGALWGFLQTVPNANYIFASLSLIAAVAILIWLYRHKAAYDIRLAAALGLILAGTFGNCYDRLVYKMVRDFIYVEAINWPIFNLADSFLVCGAFLLVVQAFFGAENGQDEKSVEESAEVSISEKT